MIDGNFSMSNKEWKELKKLHLIDRTNLEMRVIYAMFFAVKEGRMLSDKEVYREFHNKLLNNIFADIGIKTDAVKKKLEIALNESITNQLCYHHLNSYATVLENLDKAAVMVRDRGYSLMEILCDTTITDRVVNYFSPFSQVEVIKDFQVKLKLLYQVLETAQEHEFMTLPFIQKVLREEYVSTEELKNVLSFMKKRIVSQEKEKELKRKKEWKKVLEMALKTDQMNDQTARKLEREEEVTAFELRALQRKCENVERMVVIIEERDLERAKADEKKLVLENLRKKALEFDMRSHKTVQKILQGVEIPDNELIALKVSIDEKLIQLEGKRRAKKELPHLMKKAEELFHCLSAYEQKELRSKLNQYKAAFQKMEKPRKLKRNLEWIIEKMSVGK